MDRLRVQVSCSRGELVRIFERRIDVPVEGVADAISAGIRAFDEAFARELGQVKAATPTGDANGESRVA